MEGEGKRLARASATTALNRLTFQGIDSKGFLPGVTRSTAA